MAHILAVGIATLDIVNEVAQYPPEDSEVRALSQRVQRGGNATNTLVVLSQLGHSCAWAGVLADTADAAVVLDELRRYRIGLDWCRTVKHGRLPTSCVTLSRGAGTRTIVHFRDLPEYDAGSFSRIPLQQFDWLHFEGRNVAEVGRMMREARQSAPDLPVSLEVEKPREGIDELFAMADLLLFSRDYARWRGLEPPALLASARESAPRADLVCSLGEHGAIGLDRHGAALSAGAWRPARVVDTLGAGDTFNAGVIDRLQRGAGLQQALESGCRLAGLKCGQPGLHDLATTAHGPV